MQKDMREEVPLVCVSTQVIEAGVDISFTAGIRLTAGLDNIVQTAGRINRNGENDEDAPVYVIGCIGESLSRLREISEAKKAAEELICEYKSSPDSFENDLSSKPAVDYYYKTLYRNMKTGQQDFHIPNKTSLYDLLSENSKAMDFVEKKEGNAFFLHQAFAQAGKLFRVMDDNSNTLLVPYKYGSKIIDDLSADEAKFDFAYRKKLLDQAKEYAVNVFDYQIQKMEKAGAIRRICEGSVLVLMNETFYDDELGLDPEGGNGEWSTLIL